MAVPTTPVELIAQIIALKNTMHSLSDNLRPLIKDHRYSAQEREMVSTMVTCNDTLASAMNDIATGAENILGQNKSAMHDIVSGLAGEHDLSS